MSREFIPISFSFPENRMLPLDIENKTHLLSSIIPGEMHTYIHPEDKYYDELRRSFFVRTNKKGGWDCMRHYEILGCGSVPLFTDLEHAPPKVMPLLPRDLLFEARQLYEEMKNEMTDEKMSKYKILCRRFRDYFEKNLTCRSMAKYILTMSNSTDAKRVLYLSPFEKLDADYLRCMTLVGFKQHLGANCHDYPKIPHIYKEHNVNSHGMWGWGVTYDRNIDNSLRDDSLDETIEQDIRDRKYDIIIYAISYLPKPYYDLVREYYPADKIILFDGDDWSHNFNDTINNGHYYFLRENY